MPDRVEEFLKRSKRKESPDRIEEFLKRPIVKKPKPLSIEEALALPVVSQPADDPIAEFLKRPPLKPKPLSIEEALSAPVINRPSAPAAASGLSIPQNLRIGLQEQGPGLAEVALTGLEALGAAMTGDFGPTKEVAEQVGRGVINLLTTFDPSGGEAREVIANALGLSDERMRAITAAREARRPQAVQQAIETTRRELAAEAAQDPSLFGRATRVVGGLPITAGPAVAGGITAGVPGVVAVTALQSLDRPENLATNVALAAIPIPAVAPIIRRIRAGRGATAAEAFSTTAPGSSLPASSRVREGVENLLRAEEGLPLLEAADIAAARPRASSATTARTATGPRAAFEAELQAAQPENLVTAAERDGVLEVITALRKAGLLTGFKTHLKNLGGNLGFQLGEEAARLPGAIVDIVLSARTGQRTLAGPSLKASGRSALEAATRGLKEAGDILRAGGTAEDLARLEISRELRSGSKILDGYVNTVFRTLNAEDRIARVFAFRRALEDRARAQALSEARSGAVARGNVNSRARELVDAPSESLRAEALADAETAVFANPNAISEFIAAGRQRIATRPGGRAINATIDLFLPFVRTPTNVIARMLDFTPLGLAKADNLRVALDLIRKAKITPGMQRRFSQSLGRATIGSALIALGARLYDRGLLTGFREDDPARSARDEAAGRTPGALLIGDTWRQIAGFAPLSNLLVLGATLQRESNQEREGSLLEPIAEAGAQVIGEQPLAIGAQQIASALRQPGSTAARLGGGVAGSFVPTAVSDVAQAIDQTGREARSLPARVAARVPGLRGTLPEDADVLGQPRQAPGPVGAIADPTRATTDVAQRNPVLAELLRLDYGVSGFRKDRGGSDDDYRRRVQDFGRLYQSFGAQLVSSPRYRSVTDEDRRFLFKTLNDRSKQLVDEGQLNRAQSLLNPASLFAALLKRRGRQEAERRKTGRR